MIDEYILTDNVASRWVEHWNRRDIDGLVAMYDDTLECRSPFIRELIGRDDGLISNKSDLKLYFAKVLETYPDLNMALGSVSTGINSVSFSYTCLDGYVADASLTLSANGEITVSNFTYRRENIFADRLKSIPKSFIREILKVTSQPEIISFAGGLPNPSTFPVEAVNAAAAKVLADDGRSALQYAVTEGYKPLREYIAARYMQRFGMNVKAEEILITNGSQQGLDLIGKLTINPGDGVVLETPSYLGAIQAFSAYGPRFLTVPLPENGIDTEALRSLCEDDKNVKLLYCIPNFQNPTGISYTDATRRSVAGIVGRHPMLVVEDDPYGEIRFMGEHLPPIKKYLPEQTLLLGSFSKIIAPGLRMGWIVAPQYIIEKLVVLKQAADLHSNFLSQRIIYQFLQDNSIDDHIVTIRNLYRHQRDYMVTMIERYFPENVKITRPEGGMFLWATLPEGIDAKAVFDIAIREKVAFVPGAPFHLKGVGGNTMRLNFTNSEDEKIEHGIEILGGILHRVIEEQ